MKLKIYQVDAFAFEPFSGNPAAVCPLDEWLDEMKMKQIANENNLSETAFFVPKGRGYHIRWFTPNFKEVDLCGHATLASAHVIFKYMGAETDTLTFDSASGELTVSSNSPHYVLNFPSDEGEQIQHPELQAALGLEEVTSIIKGRDDYLVVVDSEDQVRKVDPDMSLLSKIESRGVIVSAPGLSSDAVSRCFYPRYGINEDPVTGSAHTLIVPYWSKRFNKTDIIARQLSQRGGTLHCKYLRDRVELGGSAVTYLEGEITIS